MREQLTQYVNLLFAGAQDADEIRAEILQNTLERYDDLIAQGKSPEAAYRLAISGIGDISEILGTPHMPTAPHTSDNVQPIQPETADDIKRKKTRAIAIALYILCALPLIILSDLGLDNLGLCLTLALVAFATYLIMISKHPNEDDDEEDCHDQVDSTPQKALKKSISSLIWAVGLAVYLIISFATGAWYITWIIFPLLGCTEGLVKAIIDLREACRNEN